MLKNQSGKRTVFWIMLATVGIIFMTRLAALIHNRGLHPDEHVFYLGTTSLLNAILHPGMPFEEYMEYPEGSYYFHLPFQLMGKAAAVLTGRESDLQVWGRIASVSYFSAAVLLGMRLLGRHMGKNSGALAFYGLTMCFSLFFIEQSRYGTGDMISLMLLMLLINLTAKASESGRKTGWWTAAFFVSGILAAVKYPQIVFMLIPLWAFLGQPGDRKGRYLALFLLAVAVGFFLFSPKTMADPGYILRVSQRESRSYSTSRHEHGGPANHLLELGLYLLIYSDFPLLPLMAFAGLAGGVLRFVRNREGAPTERDRLFAVVIPGVSLFFFAYNLFVPTLFFRTLTPFFGVLVLYTAAAAEKLYEKGRWSRMAIILLTVMMVLRGGWMIAVLSGDREMDALEEKVQQTLDENWKETISLRIFEIHIDGTTAEHIPLEEHWKSLDPLVERNGGWQMRPGQLVISGAQEFYLGQDYLLPVEEGKNTLVRQWADFKQANEPYLVGQLYPRWYYYLFGGWLRGGTLSQYEFPCHFVYYRSR